MYDDRQAWYGTIIEGLNWQVLIISNCNEWPSIIVLWSNVTVTNIDYCACVWCSIGKCDIRYEMKQYCVLWTQVMMTIHWVYEYCVVWYCCCVVLIIGCNEYWSSDYYYDYVKWQLVKLVCEVWWPDKYWVVYWNSCEISVKSMVIDYCYWYLMYCMMMCIVNYWCDDPIVNCVLCVVVVLWWWRYSV